MNLLFSSGLVIALSKRRILPIMHMSFSDVSQFPRPLCVAMEPEERVRVAADVLSAMLTAAHVPTDSLSAAVSWMQHAAQLGYTSVYDLSLHMQPDMQPLARMLATCNPSSLECLPAVARALVHAGQLEHAGTQAHLHAEATAHDIRGTLQACVQTAPGDNSPALSDASILRAARSLDWRAVVDDEHPLLSNLIQLGFHCQLASLAVARLAACRPVQLDACELHAPASVTCECEAEQMERAHELLALFATRYGSLALVVSCIHSETIFASACAHANDRIASQLVQGATEEGADALLQLLTAAGGAASRAFRNAVAVDTKLR